MKRPILYIVVLATLLILLCGCFDDEHYYGTYDYDAIERFMENCQECDIHDYYINHYSLHDIFDMYGYETIQDEMISYGWFSDYYFEVYNDGYSEGYNVGYEDGRNTGYADNQKGTHHAPGVGEW